MAPDKLNVKQSLECEFDIPFTVDKTFLGGEPCYQIAPSSPGKELFTIKVTFQNHIRLKMEFIPQKYGVPFVKAMGMQPPSSKKVFAEYAGLLLQKGAKCTIRVNESNLNLSQLDTWPATWNSFEARVTKMPIVSDEAPNYDEIVKEWASLMIGMVLSLADIVPIDNEDQIQGYAEGSARRVEVNRYERNPLNRKLCLEANGYSCKICGFNFQDTYGDIGHHYIHVHHITPVSQIGQNYIIDPINDLIPVCPNCHAMLHRTDPPIEPEALKSLIIQKDNTISFTLL